MPGFKEYTMMFQLSASTAGNFQSAFTSAQNSIQQLQSRIDALNRQQGDITAYQKQQSAVERTKAKLETLRKQYDNLKAAQDKAGGSNVDLQNKMLAKQLQIEKTSAALDQQTAKLDKMGAALNEAGVDTNRLGDASAQLESELSSLRQQQMDVADSAQDMGQGLADSVNAMQEALVAAGVVEGLKAVFEALKQCSEAAMQYETAMAGVQRTVGGSESFINGLGEQFKALSTQMPITAGELASIATTAGQLGIAQENVESFTTVMAQLATTTDLTADDAATMLAQFANITGTTDYERLGSTVAELGDATATTASKVVQMSQGMAAAASMAGFSETDILAVAASVGSLGIEAQAGSTAMSTLISTLYKATETGDKLDQFAAVAGMTANEFKQAWAEDAVGAMNSFIQGLNDVERNGKSAVVILDELGINNVRQTKAILGLASAGDLLSNTIGQANNAWNENTALAEKAGIMYGTTEAKLTMMQNAANNVKVAVGDALNGALAQLAAAVTPVLQGVATFIEQNPAIVQALTTTIGIVAAVTGGILALSAAIKVATIAAGIVGTVLSGGVLPVILGVTAGVAALAGGAVYLSSVLGDTSMSFEEMDEQFDQTMSDIKKQNHIVELCEEYRQLQEELANTGNRIEGLDTATSVGVQLTAEAAVTLTPEDFVPETTVDLTPEQAAYLAAADFIPEGTTITLTAAQGNTLAAAGFLDNQTVTLTPEAANKLLADGFIDDNTLALYAQQGNYIEGQGFVTDTEIELTPEAAAHLAGTEFISGNVIQLTPEAAAFLEAKGFLVGSEVELTPEAAALLAAEGFLDGTDVQLTPEAAERLAAEGFLSGQTVSLYGKSENPLSAEDFVTGTNTISLSPSVIKKLEEADMLSSTTVTLTPECVDRLKQQGLIESDTVNLTAEAAKKLIAMDFVSGDEVTVTGVKNGDKLIPVEEFVSGGTTVTISPDLGDITDFETKLSGLKSQISAVETDLSSANTTLSDMQTAYDELHNKLTATTDTNEKSALQQQLTDLGGLIDIQKGKIDELQGTYDSLNAEYTETQSTLDTLTAKEERLAEIKAELVAESGGLISATDAETEAFNNQVDALEAIARMKQAESRQSAYDNIVAQAKDYADAVKNAESYQRLLDEASQNQADIIEGMNSGAGTLSEQLQDAYNSITGLYDSQGLGFNWDDQEVQGYVSEVERLMYLLTGENYDFNTMAGLEATMSGFEASATVSQTAWQNANDEVQKYAEAVLDANDTQQTFLDNLVSGVMDGGMSLQYLEGLLNEQFADIEGGAEIVAEAMDYVRKHVEDAANSTDGMGDGFDEAADSALEFQNAIAPIAEEMEKLGKEFTEAYNSSLKNVEGWFDVFEKAGKIKINPELDIGDMTGNLMSQVKYIEQYTQMLQDAAAMGVNTDLLASLSDGSEESAAALAEITSSSQAEIDQLNAAYESAAAARETFASTTADMQTDFSTKMSALEQQLKNTINEMEMSGEAAANARSTLQAMADAADGMASTVTAAYARIANAAQAQLNKIHAPSINLPGYAVGTVDAAPGYALVGEKGPELVYFGGGEQVYTAEQTAAMTRNMEALPVNASSYHESDTRGIVYDVTFAPVYNISGGSNTEQIRTMIEEHDEGMRSRLEDLLKEIEVDERRRAFA